MSSNVLTRAVAGLAAHPARGFLEAGLALTLATDGVTMTDTSLSAEYHKAHTQLGFSPAQLLACIETGFLCSFQPPHVRAEMAEEAVRKARHILNA